MGRSNIQVNLQPDVLRWARQRARYDSDTLARKIGVKPERVSEWYGTVDGIHFPLRNQASLAIFTAMNR